MFRLIFVFLVSLSLVKGGWAACTLSDISVSQSATGATVEGKAKYEVVISNGCICSQSNLLIKCDGFNSVDSVDPQVFRRPAGDGRECLVNGGQPVHEGYNVTFKYAWDAQFTLSPVSSQINCS